MEPDLFERVRHDDWPRLTGTGGAARAQALRRRWVRSGLVVVAALAVVGAGTAVILPMVDGSDAPGQVAADAPSDLARESRAGVTFSVPEGWMVRPGSTEVLNGTQVCVAPVDDPRGCPIAVGVADVPSEAPTTGLYGLSDALDGCGNSSQITAVSLIVQGRAATAFSGRCARRNAPIHVWELDNRTVYVTATRSAVADVGAAIFESVEIPADWPEPVILPSSTPTAAPDAHG